MINGVKEHKMLSQPDMMLGKTNNKQKDLNNHSLIIINSLVNGING